MKRARELAQGVTRGLSPSCLGLQSVPAPPTPTLPSLRGGDEGLSVDPQRRDQDQLKKAEMLGGL